MNEFKSVEQAGEHPDSVQNGEKAVPAEMLVALLYEELKQLARSRLAAERSGHTLTATALVHEAYLRLESERKLWPGRRLFFFAAADAMRRVLIDHARRRNAAKRGGGEIAVRVEDSELPSIDPDAALDLVSLDEHLDQLRLAYPQGHEVVMLRYFAGLSAEDTAALLGVDRRTVLRRWDASRAWLLDRMGQTGDGPCATT